MNRIILMGRLTRDPELRHTGSGTAVASFSLAVERDFRDKTSGREDHRLYRYCRVASDRRVCRPSYFTKGRMAVVEGRLQMRDWHGPGWQQAPQR